MNDDTRQFMKDIVYYSSLGFSISLAIFIGLFFGIFLDQYVLGSTPICTLIGLGLGIAAGFRNIFLAMKKSQNL
ncbi:MAG: AtpZ/AtpI family protein [Candidatus Magnetomorum sp.]|nr:AtpZ/AtpI family protein [Candidatus Magnetomorum sp.]